MAGTFLKAGWRKLVMANYAIDPGLLERYRPHHTQIDFFKNTCYVSLVGFMFIDTRVMGLKIPFHVNFEEVNLRFYVKTGKAGKVKRGVVFIKEIVPRPMLAATANLVYKENYEAMTMKHSWKKADGERRVSYSWRKKEWHSLEVRTGIDEFEIAPGSEEEFITEHYWGYTKASPSKTLEYEVVHPKWKVYKTLDYRIDVDFETVYGTEFRFLTTQEPDSVFLAEGSDISVLKATRL